MIVLRAEALAARLRELGIATPQQLEHAKQDLPNTQERFSAILVRQGVLRDADIGKRLTTQLGQLPQRIDPNALAAPALSKIPLPVWLAHRLLPVGDQEGTLLLATDDPFSVFALDFLRGRCGCELEAVLVREQDFLALLEAVERPVEPASPSSSPAIAQPPRVMALPGVATAPLNAKSTVEVTSPRGPADLPVSQARGESPAPRSGARPEAGGLSGLPEKSETGDEPIVKLIDSMLSEAVRMRASDVHIESGMHDVRVRYRIDGVLHDVNKAPKALQGPVVSRIKIMGGLNIAEKRLPQDGRLQLSVEGRPLDVRVSTLPATHGESIVMRLLDRSQPIRGLPEMGLLSEDQGHWDELIHRPHGMVLVTGPTGSGKTTTLYGALATLNRPDRKLITVEDPVEYQLAGVNQVSVKSSIGLTFSAGLRAMLRQAPDVIMVGEIRDQETAQIAIQAALTGHLVLSTLHTNDAASSVTRLIDMGIAPFLVASTVQGVLAQRLVRRICPACRITDDATAEERAFLGSPEVQQVIRSHGCEMCHNSGFVGRIGIFELLLISDAVRRLVVTKTSSSVIQAAAVGEGMRRLRDDGCTKIREGLTTMAEVLRVVTEG